MARKTSRFGQSPCHNKPSFVVKSGDHSERDHGLFIPRDKVHSIVGLARVQSSQTMKTLASKPSIQSHICTVKQSYSPIFIYSYSHTALQSYSNIVIQSYCHVVIREYPIPEDIRPILERRSIVLLLPLLLFDGATFFLIMKQLGIKTFDNNNKRLSFRFWDFSENLFLVKPFDLVI